MKKSHLSTEQLLLYLLNELSDDKRKEIDKHLNSCHTCQKHLEKEGSFHQILFEHGFISLKEFDPEDLRTNLLNSLRKESIYKIIPRCINKLKKHFPKKIDMKPFLVYASIFLIGLFSGLSIHRKVKINGQPFMSRLEEIGSLVAPANMQITQENPSSREIRISYKMHKEETIQGTIDNLEIQNGLIYTLMYHPNDNVRLDAIELLSGKKKEPLICHALIHALKNDTNPGIRLKAVRQLITFPFTQEIRQILIHTLLLDSNQGVRIEAANQLNRNLDEQTKQILENAFRDETYFHYLIQKNQTKWPIQ